MTILHSLAHSLLPKQASCGVASHSVVGPNFGQCVAAAPLITKTAGAMKQECRKLLGECVQAGEEDAQKGKTLYSGIKTAV